ncbi:MAG: heavy-metal-associated domain-containing protein, partial [Chloroflexota bacterium]
MAVPESPRTASGEPAVLRMKIGGMSCSFCVNTLKTATGRLPGVQEVGVSLAHEEALVRYDPELLDAAQIRETVGDLGYTV